MFQNLSTIHKHLCDDFNASTPRIKLPIYSKYLNWRKMLMLALQNLRIDVDFFYRSVEFRFDNLDSNA